VRSEKGINETEKQEKKRQRRLGKDTPAEEQDVATGETIEAEDKTGENDEEKE
jgi:hypothetical protein